MDFYAPMFVGTGIILLLLLALLAVPEIRAARRKHQPMFDETEEEEANGEEMAAGSESEHLGDEPSPPDGEFANPAARNGG